MITTPKKQGGARPGAGRPRKTDPDDTSRTPRIIRLSDEHWDALGALADALHTSKIEVLRRFLDAVERQSQALGETPAEVFLRWMDTCPSE